MRSSAGAATNSRAMWVPLSLGIAALAPVVLFAWTILGSGVWTQGWFWAAGLIGFAALVAPMAVLMRLRSRHQHSQ